MNAEEILKKSQLFVTDNRVMVLNILLDSTSLLTYSQIYAKIGKSFDRVTLYRTLGCFEEKGIVHKVSDQEGTICYAISKNKDNNHIHFKCQQCKKIVCMDKLHIPESFSELDFLAQKYNFLIEGICKGCRSEKVGG